MQVEIWTVDPRWCTVRTSTLGFCRMIVSSSLGTDIPWLFVDLGHILVDSFRFWFLAAQETNFHRVHPLHFRSFFPFPLANTEGYKGGGIVAVLNELCCSLSGRLTSFPDAFDRWSCSPTGNLYLRFELYPLLSLASVLPFCTSRVSLLLGWVFWPLQSPLYIFCLACSFE